MPVATVQVWHNNLACVLAVLLTINILHAEIGSHMFFECKVLFHSRHVLKVAIQLDDVLT